MSKVIPNSKDPDEVYLNIIKAKLDLLKPVN